VRVGAGDSIFEAIVMIWGLGNIVMLLKSHWSIDGVSRIASYDVSGPRLGGAISSWASSPRSTCLIQVPLATQ
jgi:hypothetical protein